MLSDEEKHKMVYEAAKDVRTMKDKVENFEPALKSIVSELKNELTEVRAERQAERTAGIEKERQLADVQADMRRMEAQLKEELVAHEETRAALEKAEHALQEKEDLLRDADAARAAECGRASASETHWQGECESKDAAINDLSAKARAAEDATRAAEDAARAAEDAARAAEDRAKSLERRVAEMEQKEHCAETETADLRERLELEIAARREMEAEHGPLRERRGELDSAERAAHQRERDLRAQEMELERLRQDLAAREERLAAGEGSVAGLERQRQEFELQRQEAERQLERQRQELERQILEQRDKCRRFGEADKENKDLRKKLKDQKDTIWDLESNCRKHDAAAKFLTPGEYYAMAKKHEGESFSHENLQLKHRNMTILCENQELDQENRMLRRANEVMRKHFPSCAWEKAMQEIAARVQQEEGPAGRALCEGLFDAVQEPAQEPAP